MNALDTRPRRRLASITEWKRKGIFLACLKETTELVHVSRGTCEGALYPPRGHDSTSPPPNSSPGFVSIVSPLSICSWSLNALLSMLESIDNREVSRVTAAGLESLVAYTDSGG